jgi:MFS transporter, FSR family, fosmidomycin resistance protein
MGSVSADPSAPAVAGPVPIVASRVDPARPNLRLLTLLALGHLIVDSNQGSLAALLPFLRSGLALSYTATGVIVLAANITSSLIQPLFGYFADKTSRRWILPVSVLLSALGLALTGLAPSYEVLLLLVVVAGFGVAAYHPEGYRTATAVAGDRKVTGVSVFSTGGNVGIAVGPPLITALVTGFGLRGTLGMAIPGVLVAALLTGMLPWLSAPLPARARSGSLTTPRTMAGAMSLLIFVIAIRSWTQLGFTTYVPFYYLEVLKGDPRMVGTLLGVFLGAGAVGTLVAGPIADRIGVRRYMVIVFLLTAPVAVSFLFVKGILAFVVLGALGFVLVSTFTVSVVLGQAYMPRNPGMASGLIVGFAIGAGGLGVTVLGWIADHWGLMTSLWISALMPLLGCSIAMFLPEPRRH